MCRKLTWLFCAAALLAGYATQAGAAGPDPIVYYPFDQLGGTVVDASGNGNDGTPNGGLEFVDAGYAGGCYSFNGSDAYVELDRPVQDDFTMMREVVGRYFYRVREEKTAPPDLVVVDGGKGQLSATLAELHSLGFERQQVVSLAKRLEEVYLPKRSDPVTIGKSSPALVLLKRIRDEAHRFAITYNRKVRSKRTIKSALDDIPGIGPAKRGLLLNRFGSVEEIKKAAVEDLVVLKGINEKLAQKILKVLNP